MNISRFSPFEAWVQLLLYFRMLKWYRIRVISRMVINRFVHIINDYLDDKIIGEWILLTRFHRVWMTLWWSRVLSVLINRSDLLFRSPWLHLWVLPLFQLLHPHIFDSISGASRMIASRYQALFVLCLGVLHL